MTTRNLRLRYRPIRIGWCVRKGSLQDVREALRLTHTLWGGSSNPIIPIGASAAELVELYRVDTLHPAAEDGEIKAFVDRFPHLRRLPRREELFVAYGDKKLATLEYVCATGPVRDRR